MTELEQIVLHAIQNQVNTLPAGAAKCYIGPSNSDPQMTAPIFEILPANPNAAQIRGAVLQGEGVTITVGHSRRELGHDLTSAKLAAKCSNDVTDICQAVFIGNFKEDINQDRSGEIISSRLKLRVRGRTMRMWSNRLVTKLLTVTRKKTVIYEPYTSSVFDTPSENSGTIF